METRPVVSIISAVLNEGDNIRPLCQEIAAVLGQLPPAEVIFVNDGSTDATVTELEAVRHDGILPGLRILSHNTACGKSAGLRTGVEAARGEWVILLDGDGQDDPADFISMLELCRATIGERAPLVVGVRTKRQDTLSRRLASRFANRLRSRLLNDAARIREPRSRRSGVPISWACRSLKACIASCLPLWGNGACR